MISPLWFIFPVKNQSVHLNLRILWRSKDSRVKEKGGHETTGGEFGLTGLIPGLMKCHGILIMVPGKHFMSAIVWLVIGALAQVLFASRMLVQWWVSERRGQSTVPRVFWTLSLLGGGLMLAYSLYRQDPIFVMGQLAGVVIYSRNLALYRDETAPIISV